MENLFTDYLNQYLKEAPDDPPDMGDNPGGSDEMSDMGGGDDSAPPDMPEEGDINNNELSDGDMGDENLNDMGYEDDNDQLDDLTGNGANQELHLNEKISAIMNMQLYQRFLSLLNVAKGQVSSISDNSDILASIVPETFDILSSLKRLDENINLYLSNKFLNTDYSMNLLFFNKCLNLLKFVNDMFDQKVHKGIKSAE